MGKKKTASSSSSSMKSSNDKKKETAIQLLISRVQLTLRIIVAVLVTGFIINRSNQAIEYYSQVGLYSSGYETVVDTVSGHDQARVMCVGSYSATRVSTVLLVPDVLSSSLNFMPLIHSLMPTTRVCTVGEFLFPLEQNRTEAKAGPAPVDVERKRLLNAFSLIHQHVTGNDESKKLTLIGHGTGALYASLYAAEQGQRKVARVVSVDAVAPPLSTSAASSQNYFNALSKLSLSLEVTSLIGVLRVASVMKYPSFLFSHVRPEHHSALSALINSPARWKRSVTELEQLSNITSSLSSSSIDVPSLHLVSKSGRLSSAGSPIPFFTHFAEADNIEADYLSENHQFFVDLFVNGKKSSISSFTSFNEIKELFLF